MVGNCSVYNDDGTWKAISCSDDLSIKLWDLSDEAAGTGCLGTIHGHTDVVVECMPFYDDHSKRWYGVSCSWDSTLRVWDLADKVQEREMADPDMARLRGCSVMPDGSKLFSCTGNVIRVWDLDLLRGADRFADVQSIQQTGEQLWKW